MVSAVFSSTNSIKSLKFSISNILSPEFGKNIVTSLSTNLQCTSTRSPTKLLSTSQSIKSSATTTTTKSNVLSPEFRKNIVNHSQCTSSSPSSSSSSSSSSTKSPSPPAPSFTKSTSSSPSSPSSIKSSSSSKCTSSVSLNLSTNHLLNTQLNGKSNTKKRSFDCDSECDQTFKKSRISFNERDDDSVCSTTSDGSSNHHQDGRSFITSSTSPTSNSSKWPAWVYCTRYSDRPSSGPRSRKLRKKEKKVDEKRPRTAFTAEQLARLKQEFTDNKYLTEKRRQDLSRELKLNESQIKIWFQNKRAKIKKTTGSRNPLALHLMAQGLYNHSTMEKDEDDDDDDDDDDDYLDDEKQQLSN